MSALAVGDRVLKRGFQHEGVVEAVVPLGIRVKWDAGPAMKERPILCAPGELMRLLPPSSERSED